MSENTYLSLHVFFYLSIIAYLFYDTTQMVDALQSIEFGCKL